jgi:hypothetical protein
VNQNKTASGSTWCIRNCWSRCQGFVGVGVLVGLEVLVGVRVIVGVRVSVGEIVIVAVIIAVGVKVFVNVFVAVGTDVVVNVNVGVKVGTRLPTMPKATKQKKQVAAIISVPPHPIKIAR